MSIPQAHGHQIPPPAWEPRQSGTAPRPLISACTCWHDTNRNKKAVPVRRERIPQRRASPALAWPQGDEWRGWGAGSVPAPGCAPFPGEWSRMANTPTIKEWTALQAQPLFPSGKGEWQGGVRKGRRDRGMHGAASRCGSTPKVIAASPTTSPGTHTATALTPSLQRGVAPCHSPRMLGQELPGPLAPSQVRTQRCCPGTNPSRNTVA